MEVAMTRFKMKAQKSVTMRIPALVALFVFVACSNLLIQYRLFCASPPPTPPVASLPTRSTNTIASSDNNNNDNNSKPSATCITMVGDTMIQNGAYDFAKKSLKTPRQAFAHVELLLRRCPIVIANLEGPVTTIPPDAGANGAYSFNMHPSSLKVLHDVGITHYGRANNHLRDRREGGVADTNRYLHNAHIPHFGSGVTKQEAATPLILPMGDDGGDFQIGITAFSDQGKVIAGESETNQTGILPVTTEHAQLAQDLLNEHPHVTTRIAYVHWGKNYGQVDESMKEHARILANHGYDLVVGSDGSHTVQEFQFLNDTNTSATAMGVPVLYNVGNFVFQTPGRYRYMVPTPMPYGSVMHLSFDSTNGKPTSMELICTAIDNLVVHYQPQLCSSSQATELFQSLGPYVQHTEGTIYATINLTRTDVTDTATIDEHE